ncbi:MAG: hypothetical protein IJL63_04190 [Clostridia bacterium]|nr:hypothetical protein [Clostridia bacterium]
MTRTVTRTISLLLVAIMLIGTFAGCGKSKNEDKSLSITPDVEYVARAAKDFKISFAVENGEFADSVSADDVYLSDSFYGMEAEVISHSDKNLTLQLKGDIVPNEANAYLWGTVNLKPSAFTAAEQTVLSHIDIRFISGAIDGTTLKFENGKASVNYISYSAKPDEINKDTVTIEGATVEAVDKVDDETVKLTVSADGVNSANEFADFMKGKNISVNGNEIAASLSQAYFYPVYDYAEDDGDNINITLKLFTFNGTAKNMTADQVSFADDFDGAKVVSITPEKDDDRVTTMVIAIPADSRTAEGLSVNGTVTLAAGALTNDWGDATTVETSYTREYSAASLGRDMFEGDIDFSGFDDIADMLNDTTKTSAEVSNIMLNPETLLEIQKYTRGLDTALGNICYYGQIAMQGISFLKMMAETTGVLESEHAQEMKVLNRIDGKLDNVLKGLASLDTKTTTIEINTLKNRITDYKDALVSINNDMSLIKSMTDRAKDDLKTQYPKIYGSIDEENLTDEEYAQFMHDVMEYIRQRAENQTDTSYGGYTSVLNDLLQNFMKVTTQVSQTDEDNPISVLDQICSLKYNFDSQAYGDRLNQRLYCKTSLAKAYSMLAICYDYAYDYKNPNMRSISKNFREAIDVLTDMEYIGHTAKEISQYSYNGELYVKEIVIFYSDDAESARQILANHGWLFCDENIECDHDDRFSRGCYVGFKTTFNPDEAIRALKIETNPNLEDDTWKLVRVDGVIDGVNANTYGNGHINRLTHLVTPGYLYYTKDKSEGGPLTGLRVDSNPKNAVSDFDLYQSKDYDNDELYLHALDVNYEYAPFCYPLGRRVAFMPNWRNGTLDDIKRFKNGALIDLATHSCYNMSSDIQDNQLVSRCGSDSFKTNLKKAGITLPSDYAIATVTKWETKAGAFGSLGDKYWIYCDLIDQNNHFVEKNRKCDLIKDLGSDGIDDSWDRYVEYYYVMLLGQLAPYSFVRPKITDEGYNTWQDEAGNTYVFNANGQGTYNGKSFSYTTNEVANGTELKITMDGKATTYLDHYIVKNVNPDGTTRLSLVMLDRRLDSHIYICTNQVPAK